MYQNINHSIKAEPESLKEGLKQDHNHENLKEDIRKK